MVERTFAAEVSNAHANEDRVLREVEASGGALRLCCRVFGGMNNVSVHAPEAERIARTGARPQVAELLGVPLAVRRDAPGTGDNQPATHLMIQPSDGIARGEWLGVGQSVGPVTVATTLAA